MAVAELHIDCTAFSDAIDELAEAMKVLATRRGFAFRKLEREIDAATSGDMLAPGFVSLDETHLALTPSHAITAALRRARELKVI